MKRPLLIFSSCTVLFFGACHPAASTSKQASAPSKPSGTPDYSAAIRNAIARNPPGDYNDALALGDVIRPAPRPMSEEPPVDIMTAAIQQVRDELRALNDEIRAGTDGADDIQQAIVQREKLLAELHHLERTTDSHK
jgi:hypothetical protein